MAVVAVICQVSVIDSEILQDGGGHGGPRYKPSHRRVAVTGPVGQALTAGPVEHPISWAIGHPTAAHGPGSQLQRRTGLLSVGLSYLVGGQQGLSLIIPKLAGLAANLTGQGLPILASDAAAIGRNVTQAGSDGATDVEAGHRIEIGGDNGLPPMPVSYPIECPCQPPD